MLEEEDQNQFEEFFDLEEEEEESIDKLPTEYYLTAFPDMVNFKPCYQGNFSHYTLYITNPSSLPQNIDIMLDPSSNFSISSNEITIQAGIVYSLIITFISDEAGIFQTDLSIHTLYNTITIPLTAKCIPSPLIFNDSDISQFQFSMAKTNLSFDIANCSLLTQLHVLFDFDTAAFSITPPSIDLPPFSSCPIEIKYDPNFTLNLQNDNPNNQQIPTFHIQCAESGDSISIPLNIARPNTCGLIDFGCVPVGIKQTKSIKIYNFDRNTTNTNFDINDNSYYLSMILSSSEYPEISPPFSYQIVEDDFDEEEEEEEDEYEDERKSERNKEIIFSFLSKEVGDFSETIQFGPLKYSLHAVALQQPFQVKFSNDLSSLMYLKNIADEKKSFYLSYDDKFDRKQTVKIQLQPGESKKIDTMKLKQLFGNMNNELSSVFVRWRENDYKVVQEIQLPTNEIELNEDSISFELNYGQKKKKSVNVTNKSDKNMEIQFTTDSPEFSLMSDKKMLLKPHSSKKVDIEFNPKNSKNAEGNLRVHTDKKVAKVPLKTLSAILSSTNLINFLRIDDNQTSNFIVSFCGPKQLTIKKPSWIHCDDFVNSNEAVSIQCQRIPNSVSCGYLTVNGKNSQPLSVPILAYLSSSDISFHVIRPFVLRVENHGLRTAFVTFTSYNKRQTEDQNCDVTPVGGFIPFNGSMTFTFSEETKYVLIHSGDEIMRQILNYLNPDHFYSRAFEGVDILRDEISCIDIIDDIDYNEFSGLFDQLLSIQKIDVTKMNKDIFTTSAPKIDFGEVGLFQTKEMRLWIENEKLKPIELHLSSQNQSLQFPSKILLKSEQRFCLRVSILSSKEQEINDTLIINCVSDLGGNNNDKHSVKKIEIKGFVVDTSIKFEADVLNFGVCEVGRINRGKLRLVNRKKEKTKMTVSASPPFSCPKKKFIIEPGCFVLLPIHFTPLIESPFQGKILFEPENSHRFYIPVIGFASFNPEQ